jgi:hypothetical protein
MPERVYEILPGQKRVVDDMVRWESLDGGIESHRQEKQGEMRLVWVGRKTCGLEDG